MSQPEAPDQDAITSKNEEATGNKAHQTKQERTEDLLNALEWLEQQYAHIDKQFGSKPGNSEENESESFQPDKSKRQT